PAVPKTPEPKPDQSPTPRTGQRTRCWRRLGEVVVGPCNRVAYAAAMSAVEEPGQGVNPLVLHGPVGTGKTHLLEGIYAGIRRHRPEWRVTFITSEDFTNRFVQAMRLSKLAAFRGSSGNATLCSSMTCTSSPPSGPPRKSSCTPSTPC